MTTAHAPHCPRPHPKRGPFSCNSFRRTYNSGVLGSVLTVRVAPFTVSVIEAIAAPSVVASLNVGDYTAVGTVAVVIAPRPRIGILSHRIKRKFETNLRTSVTSLVPHPIESLSGSIA